MPISNHAADSLLVLLGSGNDDKMPDRADLNALTVLLFEADAVPQRLAGPVPAGKQPMCIVPLRHQASGQGTCFSVDWTGDGHVAAWQVHADGQLVLLNRVAAGGQTPCHLSVSTILGQDFVFVANYGSDNVRGTVSVMAVRPDGSLTEPLHVYVPSGEGLPTTHARFDAPHPHFSQYHNGYVFVCDLGRNAIATLAFDALSGKLHHLQERLLHDKAGPRGLAFCDQDPTLAWVVCELDNVVVPLRIADDGSLSVAGAAVSCLPPGFTGYSDERGEKPFPFYAAPSHAATITYHNGQVFVANRGHDSIAVFDTQPDGALKAARHVDMPGRITWTVATTSTHLLATSQFDKKLESTGGLQILGLADLQPKAFVELPLLMGLATLTVSNPDARVRSHYGVLPPPPQPAGCYKPLQISGDMAYLSGHAAFGPGQQGYITGKVGAELTVEQGAMAARDTALAMLSSLQASLGSLSRVKRLVKVLGMVNATSDFTDHVAVINGFSEVSRAGFCPILLSVFHVSL